jgi:hypothetical protein
MPGKRENAKEPKTISAVKAPAASILGIFRIFINILIITKCKISFEVVKVF